MKKYSYLYSTGNFHLSNISEFNIAVSIKKFDLILDGFAVDEEGIQLVNSSAGATV